MSEFSVDKLVRDPELKLYCPVCTSCFAADADLCDECGSNKPKEGWLSVEGSPFQFLGMALDGRYKLVQFLGDGATGYVYRAQATKIFRDFAAKIVDTSRYGKEKHKKELVHRFELEVEAMSQLRNPHVVAIYESLRIDENLYVLVMDYVAGRTLQNLLDRVGRIKYLRALEIIRQIANGLFEAHSRGFIHRDLKPDNIMIERLPVEGFFARVLDFGIVHFQQDSSDTQGFRGTPLYASPEQCVGGEIDARSDIYGLGCVLFHCLTGVPPFPGKESLKVMDAHVNSPRPSLSDVNPKFAKIPGLEDLIALMLAKAPDDRIATMGEVVSAIDNVLSMDSTLRAKPKFSSESTLTSRQLPTSDFPAISAPNPRSQLLQPILDFRISDMEKIAGGIFTAVSLASFGHLLVVADRKHNVHLIGMRNDGYFETFSGANQTITSVTIDQSCSFVFASTLGRDLWRWDVSHPENPPVLLKTTTDRIYAMDAGHNEVICGTDKGRILNIDAFSGKERVLVENGAPASVVSLCSSRRVIYAAGWDCSVREISFSGNVVELDPLQKNGVSMAISEKVVAILDGDGTIRMFGPEPDKFIEISTGDSLSGIVFAPDGSLITCSNKDGFFQLSDLRNEALMYQWT